MVSIFQVDLGEELRSLNSVLKFLRQREGPSIGYRISVDVPVVDTKLETPFVWICYEEHCSAGT